MKTDIITEDKEPLEAVIGRILIKKGKTVTTAESCSGGLLAGRLVNASGISECFKEGFITYSNEAKMKYLNVSIDTLEEHGAVSEECAYEMCAGVLEQTGADYAMVTTGVAGPGASEHKPAGLVYIGIGTPKGIQVYKNLFTGDRKQVRESTVTTALDLLYQALCEE